MSTLPMRRKVPSLHFDQAFNGLAPEPRRGKTIYETGDESKRKVRRSVRVTQHAAWFAAMQ
jgi:hypothetical protein